MSNIKRLSIFALFIIVVFSSFIASAYYNSQTGRWLTRDPLGITPAANKNPFNIHSQYKDGLNLYQYVLSRPVVASDPLGLSTCNGKYIAGRGKFKPASLGSTLSTWARGDIGSTLDLIFRPDKKVKKHCFCDKITFAQIFKEYKRTKTLNKGIFEPWQIDEGFPYRLSEPWIRTIKKESYFARMHDDPGLTRWGRLRYYYLNQDFETCAVCVEGREKGANYGCVKWGHTLTELTKLSQKRAPKVAKYYVIRYIWDQREHGFDDSGDPDEIPKVYIESRDGTPPSTEFHSIVDKYLKDL